MEELDEYYEIIIPPSEFIHLFKDLDDFRDWAELGNVDDLKSAISEFEIDELYEYCQVMKEVMDEKIKI